MAATIECPDCKAWNPPQATRCRSCGRELRGPLISFDGPPLGAPRPRSAADQKEAEERRSAAFAQAMQAQRADARDGARKRTEYLKGKERLKREVGEPDPPPGALAVGTESAREEEGTGCMPTAPGRSGLTRLSTHIEGLDEALGGGLPAGYVVVLGGAPGTMKSSLAFWIVAHACGDGRRALYVAAEESMDSLLRQMGALGLDLDTAAKGVKILEPRLLRKVLKPGRSGDWLAALRAAVEGARAEGGLDLLVIDSLDGLEVLARFEDRRQELFRLFEWLRDLGLTSLVIAERPDYVVQGTVLQGRYDEDFLADGVLTLRLHPISDVEVQRRIRIAKMRGTKHETGYLALHVGDGALEVGRILST